LIDLHLHLIHKKTTFEKFENKNKTMSEGGLSDEQLYGLKDGEVSTGVCEI
jgi:hypothetical protein